MTKPIRGRAGRMVKKASIMDTYGTTLAHMLGSQVRLSGAERLLHLSSPGAVRFAEQIAEQLGNGEIVILVYTYDELEETRAALAGFGNVHVINEIDDLDPDEPPFDVITCIAPYNLGRDTVAELVASGLSRLAAHGTFYLAGDKQQEFTRYEEILSTYMRNVQQLATKGQYRVVSAQARDIRRGSVNVIKLTQ